MKIIECGTEESNNSDKNDGILPHMNMHFCDNLMKDLYSK